jgi:hypothetical protein
LPPGLLMAPEPDTFQQLNADEYPMGENESIC